MVELGSPIEETNEAGNTSEKFVFWSGAGAPDSLHPYRLPLS